MAAVVVVGGGCRDSVAEEEEEEEEAGTECRRIPPVATAGNILSGTAPDGSPGMAHHYS